jgi:hypothetical protein
VTSNTSVHQPELSDDARQAWTLTIPVATILGAVLAGVAMVCLGWMLLDDLGNNPAGLFCDEAEIGIRTQQFLDRTLPGPAVPLFYQHFAYSHLGALPLYAAAPVVAVLGLSDFSVRLVSVVWSALALLALWGLTRHLRWRNGGLAVALFAFSPVFIHLARISMGHAPSLFVTCAGLLTFALGRDRASLRWSLLAGLLLGASGYGNAAWYIAAPVFVLGLAIGELVVSRWRIPAWRTWLAVQVGLAIAWAPLAFKLATDDEFLRRFREKGGANSGLGFGDRVSVIVENYPKYFRLDYLFRYGEAGGILRHSVPGAGLLPWVVLPLLLLGLIAVLRGPNGTGRLFAIAGLVTLVLYPAPDILTTTELSPPYTFAVFSTAIGVPLLAGFGIHWASGWLSGARRAIWGTVVLPVALLAVLLIGSVRFMIGPYTDYPLVSAGYYGWQFGSRQAVEILRDHADEYDRLGLDPDFNEAVVFLDFYLWDAPEIRAKSFIGAPEEADLRLRSLFVQRAERFNGVMQTNHPARAFMRVLDVIPYPDGTIAFYVVEVDISNAPGEPGGW